MWCRREIAGIKAQLLVGDQDVEGLCMALSDWSEEPRIIQQGVGSRHARRDQELNNYPDALWQG